MHVSISLVFASSFNIWKEETWVNLPESAIESLVSDTANLRITNDRAIAAVLLGVARVCIGVEIGSCVFMLKEKLCLAINVPCDIITVALNYPVVTTITISTVSKGRHLLSPAHRWLELGVWVKITASVHVFKTHKGTALELFSCSARLSFIAIMLLQCP